MLRNYLTTALRSLRRHWSFTTINVIGLGVGIAVSTLLLLFVRSELAVNDFFPNAEHIYRIDTWHTDSDGSIRYIATNPVGETIKQKAPGIEARTWVYGLWVTVGAEGDYYRLDEPRSAVLRADVARTLFDDRRGGAHRGRQNVPQRGTAVHRDRRLETLPRNSPTQFRGDEYKILLSEVGTWPFSLPTSPNSSERHSSLEAPLPTSSPSGGSRTSPGAFH